MAEALAKEFSGRALEGLVVSNKMEKTIVVKVVRRVKDKRYGKIVKKSMKLKAHDETNQAHEGDRVLVQECKPYSKEKTWQLAEVLEAVKKVD